MLAASKICSREQLDCAVNSIGSMFQIFFTSERVKDEASAKKADAGCSANCSMSQAKAGYLHPSPSQFETCFVSYAHAEDDVDKTIEAYGKAFREVKK